MTPRPFPLLDEASLLQALNLPAIPTTRSALLRFLNSTPPCPSIEHLCHLLQVVDLAKRANDSAAIIPIVNRSINIGQWKWSIRVLKDMARARHRARKLDPSKGLESCVAAFEAAVASLVTRKDFHAVVKFTNAAIYLDVVSVPLLRHRMRALCERESYARVVETFELFKSFKLSADRWCYDDLVLARLKMADLEAAKEALGEKEKRKLETTSQTVVSLLEGMGEFGGNRTMEEKILRDSKVGVSESQAGWTRKILVLNKMMSERAKVGDTKGALAVLPHYDFRRFPGKLPSSPLFPDIPKRTKDYRPRPDAATFATLMGIALSTRNHDLAIDLFVYSLSALIPPNDHTIAALVRSIVARDGVVVGERFVNSLASGVRLLPRDIVLPPFEPTPVIRDAIFECIIRRQGLAQAVEFLDREQKAHTEAEVTNRMVNLVVLHLSRYLRAQPAITANFILRLIRLTFGRRRPKLEDLADIIRSSWERNRILSPARRRSRLEKQVGRQSRRRRSVAITSAARIHQSLRDRGSLESLEMIQHILRTDGMFNSVHAMWKYIETKILAQGLLPSHQVIAVVMRASVREGDAEEARRTMQRAIELGVQRHISFYSVLLGGASRTFDAPLQRQILAEAREHDLRPDRIFYLAIATAAARSGNPALVTDVIALATKKLPREMSPLDVGFTSVLYRALVTKAPMTDVLSAQEMVLSKLKAGLVPDRVLYHALNRTRRYLRRQGRKAQRGSAEAGATTQDTAETFVEATKANDRVRKQVLRYLSTQKMQGRASLRRLEAIWENRSKKPAKASVEE
ncbi:hypothetical protein MNV49_002641 [Pseudohyphozyma bogoriensis]|nr:hypothetical protein MNV49_002641 [Pseudohyphozyma bogoriensis]